MQTASFTSSSSSFFLNSKLEKIILCVSFASREDVSKEKRERRRTDGTINQMKSEGNNRIGRRFTIRVGFVADAVVFKRMGSGNLGHRIETVYVCGFVEANGRT